MWATCRRQQLLMMSSAPIWPIWPICFMLQCLQHLNSHSCFIGSYLHCKKLESSCEHERLSSLPSNEWMTVTQGELDNAMKGHWPCSRSQRPLLCVGRNNRGAARVVKMALWWLIFVFRTEQKPRPSSEALLWVGCRVVSNTGWMQWKCVICLHSEKSMYHLLQHLEGSYQVYTVA